MLKLAKEHYQIISKENKEDVHESKLIISHSVTHSMTTYKLVLVEDCRWNELTIIGANYMPFFALNQTKDTLFPLLYSILGDKLGIYYIISQHSKFRFFCI